MALGLIHFTQNNTEGLVNLRDLNAGSKIEIAVPEESGITDFAGGSILIYRVMQYNNTTYYAPVALSWTTQGTISSITAPGGGFSIDLKSEELLSFQFTGASGTPNVKLFIIGIGKNQEIQPVAI